MNNLEGKLFKDTAQLWYINNLTDFKVDKKEIGKLIQLYKTEHNVSLSRLVNNMNTFESMYKSGEHSISFEGDYMKVLFGSSDNLTSVHEGDLLEYYGNPAKTHDEYIAYIENLAKSDFKYDRIPAKNILNKLK